MDNNLIKINLNDFADIKKFVRTAQKFYSDIDIVKDKIVVDGKSLLGILALDLSGDVYIRIISDNVEEKRNFDAEMEAFRC